MYVLCFTRPRYQVSVYRTIGPLVFTLLEQVLAFQIKSCSRKRLQFGSTLNIHVYVHLVLPQVNSWFCDDLRLVLRLSLNFVKLTGLVSRLGVRLLIYSSSSDRKVDLNHGIIQFFPRNENSSFSVDSRRAVIIFW